MYEMVDIIDGRAQCTWTISHAVRMFEQVHMRYFAFNAIAFKWLFRFPPDSN